MDADKLENFERAFNAGTGGCRRRCCCGKEYFDDYNSGYSWDAGELEALRASGAIALDHSVGDIQFEGRDYVADCTCWHERAKKLIGFIDAHAGQIAEYLTLEKKRKQSIADSAPTVG